MERDKTVEIKIEVAPPKNKMIEHAQCVEMHQNLREGKNTAKNETYQYGTNNGKREHQTV